MFQCNQTFLGMVQMQYQARVDMVQFIDLLEKACIIMISNNILIEVMLNLIWLLLTDERELLFK